MEQLQKPWQSHGLKKGCILCIVVGCCDALVGHLLGIVRQTYGDETQYGGGRRVVSFGSGNFVVVSPEVMSAKTLARMH
eukprot:13804844-Ditylum_brightwellii.AAC.1